MPHPHPAAIPDDELLRHCTLTRSRTQGPGGQRRNKTETAVELTHDPTGVSAHADERRHAEENKRVALKRLRLRLALEIRHPVALGDARSDLWRSRTAPPADPKSLGRVVCNPTHADYPALLAEALDMVHACRADLRRAAIRLDVSPSSLLKLLKDHAPAVILLNRWREEQGLHALK